MAREGRKLTTSSTSRRVHLPFAARTLTVLRAVATPEMLDGAEADRDGNGHDGHSHLLQQLPRPFQPECAVEALERRAEMSCQQALELAR